MTDDSRDADARRTDTRTEATGRARRGTADRDPDRAIETDLDDGRDVVADRAPGTGSDRAPGTGIERRPRGSAAAPLGRRDYLRTLGGLGAAGVLGSFATTSASAQSSLDETAADQRIRENQTGSLTVEVVDENANPVSGATVDVEMTEHDFVFGSAAKAEDLNQSGDGDPYREHFQDLFNTAVLENAHKWGIWEDDRSAADDAVDWLERNGFRIRGHVCVYPVDYAVPGDVMTAVNDGNGQLIRDRTMQQIEDVITAYGDRIMEWDVVNEVVHRGLLHSGVYPDQINLDDLSAGQIQPWKSQLLADWFSKASSVIDENGLDVDVVTNDYNTITWADDRAKYTEQLGFLEDQGVGVDAIGLQGHIGAMKDGSQEWTYPAIDSVFEHYSQFDAAQRITEFDMTSGSWSGQQQRADVMERFLKTAYGHPDVDEFLVWNMWDQVHWRSEAPFFEEDWSEKPALEVWRTLVQDEWWTTDSGTTGDDGTVEVTAFLGEHDVRVSLDGEQQASETVSVTNADGGARLVVGVEGVAGDDSCADAAGGSAEVDGQTVCDVNGDGLYRDVDSNGEVSHADVQEFFSVQHRPAWKQPDRFDFNENEVVGHGDVVALFEDVATSGL